MRWQITALRLPHRRLISGSGRCHDQPSGTPHEVKRLSDWDVDHFKAATDYLQTPALLPRLPGQALAAADRWFDSPDDTDVCSLKYDYLKPYREALVPLELTTTIALGHVEFRRSHAPLRLFLDWTKQAAVDSNQRMYLAQCQLMDLPVQLRSDLSTPEIVLKAGKGDIYDANIWVGRAPTYTPLHRDPNHNLFYQMAGMKVVRLFPPLVGERVYRSVQHEIGTSSSHSIRGEEMMAGAERLALEAKVWDILNHELADECEEVIIRHGAALFIPMHWWHSIKGVGKGVTGSVNWWFR